MTEFVMTPKRKLRPVTRCKSGCWRLLQFSIILPLFIIIGYNAKLSAGLLAIFCVTTAFIFHYDFADQMQTIAFLKNIGLAGGFLFIVANGTKEWSFDRKKKYVRL